MLADGTGTTTWLCLSQITNTIHAGRWNWHKHHTCWQVDMAHESEHTKKNTDMHHLNSWELQDTPPEQKDTDMHHLSSPGYRRVLSPPDQKNRLAPSELIWVPQGTPPDQKKGTPPDQKDKNMHHLNSHLGTARYSNRPKKHRHARPELSPAYCSVLHLTN